VRLLEELLERTEEVEKLNKQLEQRVADQVGEIERLGRLRRFLPPQVADLIVVSGTESNSKTIAVRLPRCSATYAALLASLKAQDPEEVMAYASAPSCRLTPRNCLFLCSSSSLYDVVSWKA
jgi:hypothetical protein